MLTHCVLCRQEIAVLPELRQGATLTRVPSLIFKVLTGYRNVQIAIRSMAFSFFLQPLHLQIYFWGFLCGFFFYFYFFYIDSSDVSECNIRMLMVIYIQLYADYVRCTNISKSMS